MKSRRQLPAPSKTPAISGPGAGSLAADGKTWDTIWPKAPKSELPVHVATILPEETQRRMARSSAFLGGGGWGEPRGVWVVLGLDWAAGWTACGLAFATLAS